MRKLSELSGEELSFVYETNSELQSEVESDLYDSQCEFINEILDCFDRGAIEYSISNYYDYMDIKDYDKFFEGCADALHNYAVFDEDAVKMIEYANALYNRRDNMYYYAKNYDTNYDRLTTRIEELLDHVKDRLLKTLSSMLDILGEGLEYFVDFFVDCRMNGDFFVDENFVLYENVVKSYK